MAHGRFVVVCLLWFHLVAWRMKLGCDLILSRMLAGCCLVPLFHPLEGMRGDCLSWLSRFLDWLISPPCTTMHTQ
jgi:hypothetical protein